MDVVRTAATVTNVQFSVLTWFGTASDVAQYFISVSPFFGLRSAVSQLRYIKS